MALTKLQQAVQAVQAGMEPSVAAQNFGVSIEDLNAEMRAAINPKGGDKPVDSYEAKAKPKDKALEVEGSSSTNMAATGLALGLGTILLGATALATRGRIFKQLPMDKVKSFKQLREFSAVAGLGAKGAEVEHLAESNTIVAKYVTEIRDGAAKLEKLNGRVDALEMRGKKLVERMYDYNTGEVIIREQFNKHPIVRITTKSPDGSITHALFDRGDASNALAFLPPRADAPKFAIEYKGYDMNLKKVKGQEQIVNFVNEDGKVLYSFKGQEIENALAAEAHNSSDSWAKYAFDIERVDGPLPGGGLRIPDWLGRDMEYIARSGRSQAEARAAEAAEKAAEQAAKKAAERKEKIKDAVATGVGVVAASTALAFAMKGYHPSEEDFAPEETVINMNIDIDIDSQKKDEFKNTLYAHISPDTNWEEFNNDINTLNQGMGTSYKIKDLDFKDNPTVQNILKHHIVNEIKSKLPRGASDDDFAKLVDHLNKEYNTNFSPEELSS